MDKTLNIPKVKSLPSFGFYSNDTDLEEENQEKLDVCDGSTMGDQAVFLYFKKYLTSLDEN